MSGKTPDMDGSRVTFPDGTPVDAQPIDQAGNPYIRLNGCLNCGKGAGWMHPFEFVGKQNAGIDPDPESCSRACALQAEYAASIAGDQILNEASDGDV